MQNPETAQRPGEPTPALGGRIIIPGLATGHVVFHWIVQSFVVVLPEIQQAFMLNTVGVGGILSARELASGLVALPGGVVWAGRVAPHLGPGQPLWRDAGCALHGHGRTDHQDC